MVSGEMMTGGTCVALAEMAASIICLNMVHDPVSGTSYKS